MVVMVVVSAVARASARNVRLVCDGQNRNILKLAMAAAAMAPVVTEVFATVAA